jgi:neutral ceramidase
MNARLLRLAPLTLLLLAACHSSVSVTGATGQLPDTSTAGQLKAGAAKGVIRVPVGTPLGGYLRPPVGGEYLPGLEGIAAGDPADFFAEFLDFLPTAQDHDGVPLAPIPDELRTLTSPYATFSPPSRGYYDSFISKAVALYDGHDYIVLMKNDTIGMLDELVQGVIEQVRADTGIDLSDGLIMSGTHTHDGPGAIANHSTRYFWLAMDAYQPDLFTRLVPQYAAVVEQALANLQDARFGYAQGREGYEHPVDGHKNLNSFRRDRLPSYDIDQNDALRERIGVLRVDTLAGAPLAVIMNYSAHGIAFDVENQYFSGDVLAGAEREVESLMQVPLAMLIQSTTGDVSPRADGAPTLQRIERFGRLLAPQIRQVWQSVNNFQTHPDLRAVSQRVILSRETLGYAPGEYPYPYGAAQCNGVDGVPTQGLPVQCVVAPPPDPQDLADNGVGENGAFVPTDTRLTSAKIGTAILIGQPGEPLTEYGLRLLAMAQQVGYAPQDTFIWGYSQDHVGYILAPEEDDWAMGGTEGTTTFWGWKQGQRFIDVSRDLLTALRTNAPPPADEFPVNYFYRDLYALAPSPPVIPSLRPGRLVTEATDIERFGTTTFAWEGGDPVVDLPRATLERQAASGEWAPVRRANGEIVDTYYEMHLKYRLLTGAHVWTLEFEAPKDWPLGTYRFDVAGDAGSPYAIASAPFTVSASPSLQASAPVSVGDQVEVTLAYTPRPDNYRLIDEYVPSEVPAPVRAGAVTFDNHAGGLVVDHQPDIEVRDGSLVAVYRAQLAGTVSASGVDDWGNSTPP